PDPDATYERDRVAMPKGTPLVVVKQGGEPRTFTAVVKFGVGCRPPLSGGQATAPECAGGFKDGAGARTRVLQGSQLQVTGLSRGEHLFECCIHPWMRVSVEVQ